ncbi:MAG: sulfatase-like hydrolase/transferase [Chloroflexi bacterium]|jgi:choline-sulfatase|nr:sulfatase-like hydrolase/transferase [Chloroflexota bacterium]
MSLPNLLFLITDQQRADTIEAHTACQTPNLDRLAASGSQFMRCYTPNPICSPTRASLMTGLLPHSHGMIDVTHAVPTYRASFDAKLPVWPRTLQKAGYRTAYFGKWHVERSNQLQNFGFDRYEVEQYQQKLGLVEVKDELAVRGMVRQKGYRDFLLYGVSDATVETLPEYRMYSDGIRFLQEAAEDRERPWALFISTEAPHDPYVALRSYYQRYDLDDISQPVNFDGDLAGRPGIYRRIQRVWDELAWEDFAQATACYYANCTMIDEQVGRILATLDALDMRENTIIVFTSDHGDYMGEQRLMLKGIPAFEGVYRVPLILNGPGIPAGRQVKEIVSLLDLAPTLVQLTMSDVFPGHGRSLLPLLQGRASDWQSEAFAECHGQRFNYTQRVLWRGDDKYVFNGFDEDELYDLAADPHEKQNLAGDPERRSVLESMASRMWEIMRETGDSNMTQAQYGMFRFAPVGPEADG